jgi:large subunit ribosomal protein L10
MPRPEKVEAVAEIKERLGSASAVFVAEYAGLSVKAQQQLRRGLRAAGGEFKVVKMTLARRAAEELGYDELVALLTGPTGLAFAHSDAAATAKALRDFASDNVSLVVKGALLSGELLAPERIAQLADLEPRDVMLAKIAGAFTAPLSRMAGLFAALPRGLATAMAQLVEKASAGEAADEAGSAVEAAGDAPPEEAVVEEPADAPAPEPTVEAAGDAPPEEAVVEEPADAPAPEPTVDDAGDEPAGDPDDAAVEAEEE